MGVSVGIVAGVKVGGMGVGIKVVVAEVDALVGMRVDVSETASTIGVCSRVTSPDGGEAAHPHIMMMITNMNRLLINLVAQSH